MKRYIIALAAFVALALSCSKIEHGPKKEVIPDKCEYELAYSTEIVPESTAATIVAGSAHTVHSRLKTLRRTTSGDATASSYCLPATPTRTDYVRR